MWSFLYWTFNRRLAPNIFMDDTEVVPPENKKSRSCDRLLEFSRGR